MGQEDGEIGRIGFSGRTAILREPNPLAMALDRVRAAGRAILDLTVSNPTRAELPYAEADVVRALGDRRSLTYAPTPFGHLDARGAVARTYAEAGVTVDPSRIVLTASTSEAYSFLFKLLCDEGDEVLIPQPSYPLFDLIARLEGVKLAPYPLAYDGAWHVDHAAILRAISPRTRAIFMVSPNNPTGSFVAQAEIEAMARTGLPLVSDEVFAPFPLDGDAVHAPRPSSLLSAGVGELVFALNGLSKMAALPQVKLGWIAVGGTNDDSVDEALGRLELIADAFLSVGTPVQLAAGELLATRHVVVDAIRARLRTNLGALRTAIAGSAVTLLHLEGGWYATLRLPRTESEEEWSLLFLDQHDVYVHPGHFFDFADEAYAVVSLLTPEERFAEGIHRIVRCVGQRLA
jgi:alanine-synthesizing transaminase